MEFLRALKHKIGGFPKVNTFLKVLFVILVILIIILALLYFFGRKLERRQAEQQSMMKAAEQVVSMLVIDKKKLKVKESGLPKMVIDQSPKYMAWAKLPIVKAKIGPQIMSLVCEERIFDSVPVKKEVKAVISGIYITDVKGLHGKSVPVPAKKKGFFKRALEKAQEKAGAKPLK